MDELCMDFKGWTKLGRVDKLWIYSTCAKLKAKWRA